MSGLYVNTNVNSMTAQVNLQNSMGNLSEVLTRLSTGLRINSAKDDPAGLIASELLRSDITGTTQAIKNTQRANSMVAVADSALGQISNLLNDIRGLVNEAANTSAMSNEQIQANQLQVDASLDAIDRIANTTQFMGRKLLDGSMAYQTQGLDRSTINQLNITKANFGTNDSMSVTINVQEAAQKAFMAMDQRMLGSDGARVQIGGSQGVAVFKFNPFATVQEMANAINAQSDQTGVMAIAGQEATSGIINITSAGIDNDIILQALLTGKDAGNYSVKYTAGDSDQISYTITEPANGCAGVIEFKLRMDAVQNASATVDEGQLGIFTKEAGGVQFFSSTGSNVKEVRYVLDDGLNDITAVFDKTTGVLTLTGTGFAAADVVTAMDAVKDTTGIIAVAGGASVLPTLPTVIGESVTVATTDARANNGLTLTARINDTKYNNTDVVIINGTPTMGDADFKYVDQAQQAKTTVVALTDAIGNSFMEIKATNAGAAYNGYTFAFVDAPPVGSNGADVSFDSTNKIITITADFGAGDITYSQLMNAISSVKGADGQSLFTADFYQTDPTGATTEPPKITDYSQKITAGIAGGDTLVTGTTADTVGTNHGAMIITVAEGTTAAEVVDAFNTNGLPPTVPPTPEELAMTELRALFSLTPNEGSDGSGAVFLTGDSSGTDYPAITSFYYNAAMQGAQTGNVTNTTAKELVDFINNDATLSSMFVASLAPNSQTGSGKLTLFDEVAYYGCPYDGTGLQFLGPDGSKNIEFSTTDASGRPVANQQLSISWTADTPGNAESSLAAYNANASISIRANAQGGQYDDMVVRFIRVTGPEAASSVTYTGGPSNAMAYGNIGTGTDMNGKFIFYAKDGGAQYNNMVIQAKVDSTLTEPAAFTYDAASNTFTISVQSADVTLAEMMNAFNLSSYVNTFSFELDYSDTTTALTNDGSTTFAGILGSGGGTVVLGNTGTTGGHTGGVLQVNILDNTYDGLDPATASGLVATNIVDLINNSNVSGLFTANNYPGSNGTGLIMPREDTIGPVIDPAGCGTTNAPRMVTSGGIAQEGKMIVHLATDAVGNSITTAADLVAFFDTLTADQTRGVSVSLVNPNGVIGDACNTIGGNGILGPTSYIDECGVKIDNDIIFGSSCTTIADTKPLSEIVAVNGINAGFTLFGKATGTALEGVTLKYEKITDGSAPSVSYDADNKTIIVRIQENTTTASDVKALIEQSAATRSLFSVELRGDGTGKVTINDNTVLLGNGTYISGNKGGANMLWNKDEDANALILMSTMEGSDQYITINVLEGTFNMIDEFGNSTTRTAGTDTIASINGMAATSTGRQISINTSMLAMSATLGENVGSGTVTTFDITGGGAIFQIGPDVVSSQQVTFGLQSFRSEDLGGLSGRLYQLREGENADLFTNTKLADRIVKDAIVQVASARGQLGALQKTTFDSNITALQDTLEQLTAARSDILDADFATESSNLTKYQILVQAGSRVLAIANQLPQYAAQLIG